MYQFLELFTYLLQHSVVALYHNGEAAFTRPFCVADGEAFDVEPASGKQTGNSGHYSGYIFTENRNSVSHYASPSVSSSKFLPVTMGYTCSSSPILQSITVTPSACAAAATACWSSDSEAARSPRQPKSAAKRSN